VSEIRIDDAAVVIGDRKKARNFWVDVLIRLLREKPLGAVGLILVLALFFTGIFANFLAPEGYNIIHLEHRLAPPSTGYPLGNDELGRDILSRIIWGARLSMIVGVVATALHTVISTALGMLCGYLGGKFDLIVQRFVDAWICFPQLVILITLMAVVGPGLLQILLVLGVSSGLSAVRFKRSLVFAIKENMYVHASEAIGARTGRILWYHILPNIMPMIIVLFTIAMGGVILAEASLSFLGLGVPPPEPSWGGMISGAGRMYMLEAPWMAFWPGVALTLAVFGINMLGDALRDLLDPRLRGKMGSFRAQAPKKMKVRL
jgi:peptide/nickel transport system permease protein